MRFYIALLIAVVLLSALGAIPARAALIQDSGLVYLPFVLQQTSASEIVNPAIVGGLDAEPNEWPWQVFIVIAGQYACGGSIVDAEWILTAAHCVAIDGTYPVQYYLPSQVVVRAGEHRIFDWDGFEQYRNVSKVEPHPDYNPNASTNDLALLKLQTPVDLGGAAAVIPLVADPEDELLTAPGELAIATGWGSTSMYGPHSLSNTLQEVEAPIVSNAECNAAFGGGIIDTMICAGYNGLQAKDTCFGDSGGPLVVADGKGGWKLAGVTSFGPTVCATRYGGYSRISKFTDWINSHYSTVEIGGFSPSSGPAGAQVTISGSGFNEATSVSFANVSAKFDVASNNTIVATVPEFAVSGPIQVTGPNNSAVTLGDFLLEYPLLLEVKGPGAGTVRSTPGNIVCNPGDTCKELFVDETYVTLNATTDTDPNHVFAGWLGDCSGTASTCLLSVSESKMVTAVFSTITPELNVDVSRLDGAMGGVVSAPAGIDCSVSCSATFDVNSSVTLTATAGVDSKFISWGGACTGSSESCSLSMLGNQNVTALFKPATYPLTVTVAGMGAGSVTSFPAGIACDDGVCGSTFETATTVNLRAQPATGSAFGGWSGDCNGAAPACSISIDRIMTVGARFEKISVFIPLIRAQPVAVQ